MAALVKNFSCYKNLIQIPTRSTTLGTTTIAAKHLCTIPQNEENYDIVIVGGGMVGTTLACAIANNRRLECRKVLLLEGSNKVTYQPQEQYSNRVVALNQQTRTLLSSIGAWQHIEAIRHCPVRKMQVWDACSDAMIEFNEDHLSEEIAYIVENDLLLHAVNKQLAKKENVNIVYASKVENIKLPKTEGEAAKIQLQNGKKYKTKLLIGADGSNSLVRQSMGVQYVNWNYNQLGVVATLKLSEPTENIVAWQRFLPTGPIALLPLTDSLSSLVWSLPMDEAKRLLKVPKEEFVDSINSALWKIYPKDGIVESGMRALQQLLEGLSLQTGIVRQLQPSVSAIVEGSRAAFPLQFGHSVSYVQTGTALVGDAAHRVHPLAGQGVNLGFGDITVLVQLLAEAAINGAYLGDILYLRKYETLRQRYNVPTMLAIDALHRLYKGTAAPVVLARSLGLQLTNAVPLLKRAIMEHASG
ncbi:ubiquinone biosynthesis protein COQ6, mitochondrial [Nomia melanderi]|uniref:ubiquinone biosynthesis protein COQ6, mitochondrial n=1 Tax=Nomia melanderi TaxID=2448451 RepID=UPI001304464A|nr:ubiquinone biosynthesis monooxygenase COQ6, mitochondrial [Nomia melanderi]XP_031825654.1 ubiquinone biosynthesis monooxygenase COQ6, mitochondrial [Nomia melanderi]XP_031825655.1 ubiquinone biosynthesis monooxygenase COQ6, mitochondrial [Nomia melanderi]